MDRHFLQEIASIKSDNGREKYILRDYIKQMDIMKQEMARMSQEIKDLKALEKIDGADKSSKHHHPTSI